MKRNFKSLMMSSAIIFLCTALFSFDGKGGGDTLEIYLNGKQVLQQFVHADNSVKTLQLTAASGNDKVEVYYSHCGVAGKNRTITIRDEKNKLLKEFKFADVKVNRSAMSFNLKDIADFQKGKITKLNLYYSSKEIPGGKLLAAINFSGSKGTTNP